MHFVLCNGMSLGAKGRMSPKCLSHQSVDLLGVVAPKEVGQSEKKLCHYKYGSAENEGSPSPSFSFLFCFLAIMGWSPLLCSPAMMLWL